ncbi:hypothetical protein D3C87_234440 [compost metagenome]
MQENLNNTNREFKSLQKSFHNWDAGEPSADLWENLEADLAVSAVWDRLDESLELEGSPADKALVDSYEDWSPNSSGDGWSRLEEQLSRERVWTRLNTTLNYPVTTRIPWLKMAAASMIFMLIAFYTDQFSDPVREQNASGLISGNFVPETNERPIASATGAEQNPVNEIAGAGAEAITTQKVSRQPNKLLANATLPVDRDLANKQVKNEQDLQNPESNPDLTQENGVENQNNPAATDPLETTASNSMEDLAGIDELGRKGIEVIPGTLGEFHFLPFKTPFRPRFSVLVGGQFAFINEKNRTAFSSSIPSMGLAADMQYHIYSGKFRFTQDLGFSQYVQSNGSYINGRYMSSNQKLNTIHFISSIGYTYKGVTVYGGLALNRLLNGYEASRTTITNVYNSNKLQLGATAGVDYHFMPFNNKTALGVGVQYQLVSKLKSGNAMFNDIQGVKLQIKYSF